MNYIEIEQLLDELYELVHDQTIITDTIYESVAELEDDLLNYIEEMRDNSGQWLELLDMHFEHGGTFYLLDKHNNWNKYNEWKEQYSAARG